ncbi:MAG: glycosyltransferase [Balneolaceae bacterium]|nr:glycosyltransferase [Balneolaceae bacterium]
MEEQSLKDVYASLDADASLVYVVPLIRYSNKDSDYLYLLYKELIEHQDYTIESLTAIQHYKLILQVFQNQGAILHYHWLEFQSLKSLLGMPWKLLCIFIFVTFGGKIVWTIHNEVPHDRKFLGFHRWLHPVMARWADALHVHCRRAANIMKEKLKVPDHKFFICPHPSFPMKQLSKETAIQNINDFYDCHINTEVPKLLMFGNISSYKQMGEIAQIILRLPEPAKLIIAGPVKKGHKKIYKQLVNLQQTSDRLLVIPHFIQEEHVAWFYNATDLCVFNYRDILTSGGVHLALSYKKRILAPDKGCISELSSHPDVRLFTPDDPLEDILLQEIQRNRHE